MIDKDRLSEFWQWFMSHHLILIGAMENLANKRAYLENLDDAIEKLDPRVGWELGPGICKQYQLVLSPNRRRELLTVTKEIITLAPNLDEWEFHSSKPPKQWKYKIRIGEDRTEIDFSKWNYYLTSFEDGLYFDVHLIPDIDIPLLDELLHELGYLIVEGIIGEELLISAIDSVNIEPKQTSAPRANLSHIQVLAEHLSVLTDAAEPSAGGAPDEQ